MSVTTDPIRPEAQLAAVREIAARDDFAAEVGPGSCQQDFPGEFYRTPFMFLWRDKDDRLHFDRIGVRGRLLQSWVGQCQPL